MQEHASGPGLDDQARAELDSESRRHRESLAGLTPRDTGKVVAEANRHLDRVQTIMRALARRAALALNAIHLVAGLCLLAA